jgi:hypothetical protein
MKKLMTILIVALFTSMIMGSCSQKPENIKLSDLETACDYVDAMEKCGDAMIKVMENKKREDLSQEDKDYMKVLNDKLKEIGKAASKKYTEEEAEECPNFQSVKDKLKNIR